MAITLKYRNTSELTAVDFYTGESFVFEKFVYQLDNGEFVSRKTAQKKGFKIDSEIKLPSTIQTITELSQYATDVLGLKPSSEQYRDFYKTHSADLVRPDTPRSTRGQGQPV